MSEKKITLVMYHYVRDLQHSRYPAIKGLGAEAFEEQVLYICKHFQVICMEQLIEAFEKDDFSDIPERALLLTFDDGYIDHYTVVYPILKKYGIQGSFFPNARAVKEHRLLDVNKIHFILAAAPVKDLVQDCNDAIEEYRRMGKLEGFPSNQELYRELAVPNRWDPGEVIFVKRLLQNRLPLDVREEIASKLFARYVGVSEEVFARELYMNRHQIQCMKEGGMFFGLHGYDHCWLGKLPVEDMKKDIDKALQYFSDVVDKERWVMNYPYGNYSQDVLQYIAGKGCCLGISVNVDYVVPGETDPYLLPRFDTNDLPPKGTKVL